MNRIHGHKFLASFLTASLLWPSVQAAVVPMAVPGLESGAPSAADSSGMIAPVETPTPTREETDSMLAKTTSGVSLPKTPITMNFHEADIRDVLRLLALKSGMNIIYGSDVIGPITLHLDRVPFDQAFQTVLTLRGFVALPLGQRIIRVVSSTTLTQEQSQAAVFTKVFRLNYANANDVKTPIDSIRAAGGRKGISTVDSKSNSLVLTDTVEGLAQSDVLIRELDKKPQQVDIESKIVEITLDNSSAWGISWSFAKSANQNYIGGGQYNDAATLAPGVESAGGSANFTNPIGPQAYTNETPGGSGVNLFPALGNIQNLASLSFLHSESAFKLAATVSALIDKGQGKILSSPHIITLNNEEARINVVDQIPYTTTTQNGTSSQENVSFLDAGVKLTVKPTINSDRRITMKVRPEVSNRKGVTSPPSINTRNAETTVSVKDGETIAIGGLISEQEDKSVRGIPLLMSIPIFGYLFKTESTVKSRKELIIFITPRIAGE